MKNWYNEEYTFKITVMSVSHDNKTKNHCRAGHEVGDEFVCGYGCPEGFCQKCMLVTFPIMEAVRSGGDLLNLGAVSNRVKEFYCPDGVVKFRLEAFKNSGENFHTGGFYKD